MQSFELASIVSKSFTCKHCEIRSIKNTYYISLGALKRILIAVFHFETHWELQSQILDPLTITFVRSVDLYKLMCVQSVQSREVLQFVLQRTPIFKQVNPTNLYKYIESTIIYLTILTTTLLEMPFCKFLISSYFRPI